MTERVNRKRSESWVRLGRELKKRTVDPIGHVSFTLFFLVAVILLGGAGVWLELHSYFSYVPTAEKPTASLAALRTAVITFFPALAGSSCMQLIWVNDELKSLRAFATSILVILFIAAVAIAPDKISTNLALVIGGISSCIAFWMWWIANADHPGLKDIDDPDASLGNRDPSGELSGDLDGFTT